jgi:hypothetical protein
MSLDREVSAADGVRSVIDLSEFALQIQRQNFRREMPDASAESIEARLAAWLLERRGAEVGDAEGRVCHRDFGPR